MVVADFLSRPGGEGGGGGGVIGRMTLFWKYNLQSKLSSYQELQLHGAVKS